MAFIRAVLGAIFALIVLAFVILNRQDVALTWAPLFNPVSVPLYAVILGTCVFGFFWGALAVYVSHAKTRREHRAQRKEIRRLEHERQEYMKPQIPGLPDARKY